MRKSYALLLILILTSSSMLVFLPIKAQHQGNITINDGGSINPPTAPIQQENGVYVLTDDVIGGITVMASNISFNGNGHTIDQQAAFQTNGNAFGIMLANVHNVTVTNTTIINTGNGIYAIQNPTGAICLHYGGSNVIIGNNIVNNYNAMNLLETNNNIITQNNFTNNNNPYVTVSAVMLWGSSNNSIYQNNFVGNIRPAGATSFNSESSGNTWDDGVEGNFWDDYNGTDTDGDGIGDTTYEVDSKNTDRYPLIKPSNISVYLQKTTPPKIVLLSPVNQMFNESSISLVFTVDKQVSWMGYSLDGRDNVIVTGNTTISELTNGLHNVTVYAKDTFKNIGASSTVIFTIAKPEPFPTTLIATASVITVFIVGIGLFVYFKNRKH